MAETSNLNLTLKITGDEFTDFFPWELTLNESFSQVFRGELTVFTKTRREQKDLRGLLDQNASLVISQRIAGGLVTRSRYLHGIITGVIDIGVVDREEKASCYRHILIIESELARLRHTSLSCPYYRKTPPDIIEEILAKYGIQGRFSDEYVNRSSYSKKLMFDQTAASDLDFMSHIGEMYGISWAFVQGKAAKNGMGTAELYFTEGSRFSPPFYEYSDKRNPPDIENFDFLSYDDQKNVWKMDNWQTRSAIGVDGMEVLAPYPEANYGSGDWHWGVTKPGKRYESRNTLFHGYERGTPPGEIDADLKRIIEARRIAGISAREQYAGGAENLMLMPGLVFNLSHFHGPGDTAVITALVTSAALHIRSLWPRDLAVPPAGADLGQFVQVKFRAADWGKDSEKRYCAIQGEGENPWL